MSQMLLAKYHHQQDEERCFRRWRGKDHWRCPFFIFCWNEGLRLPSIDNYLECDGSQGGHGSSKKHYYDDHNHWPNNRNRPERERMASYGCVLTLEI